MNVPRVCKLCNSENTVRKHGRGRSGYPRFYCSNCKKTFQLNYVYNAYKQEKPSETDKDKDKD